MFFAGLAFVWAGVIGADVIEQGFFELRLDIVVVDALAYIPWDPGVLWNQGIGQQCVSMVKLATLIGVPA